MELIERATAACVAHLQAVAGLADEAKPTLPTIMKLGADYVISMGFYLGEPGLVRGRPRRIMFPQVQCYARADTLQVQHEGLEPTRFGQVDAEGFAGELSNLIAMPLAEYRTLLAEYRGLLERIVREHLFEPTAARPVRSAIDQRMQTIERRLHEPPFTHYYAHFGRQMREALTAP